jgi:hypothetical protein
VRDGSKGPWVVEAVQRRVGSRTHRHQPGEEETLVVIRYRDRAQQKVVKVDDALSNAVPEAPLGAWARVAKAKHRLEECLQRSKRDAGVADDEVRPGRGWQQQQTLAFLAHGFWCEQPLGGKKWTPAIT